jgi:hypothetical protein
MHSALICTDLRREGPISCLRGGDRFADCIIEASAEHLTDRIRNAGSGRTGGHGDVDDYKEADRMTSEGA